MRHGETAFKATAFTFASVRYTNRFAQQIHVSGCGSPAEQQSFEECGASWWNKCEADVPTSSITDHFLYLNLSSDIIFVRVARVVASCPKSLVVGRWQ